MVDTENWDWETGQQVVPLNDWRQQYRWVEEPQVSPDGQHVAAIVNAAEGEFYVCVNGQTWEKAFEKVNPGYDGQFRKDVRYFYPICEKIN